MASPQAQGTSPSPSPTTQYHASYFPYPSPNPTHYPSSPSPAEKFPDFSHPSPSIELISGFPRINTGSATEFPTANPVVEAPKSEDPFAAQRGTEDNPFTGDREKEGSRSPTGNEGGNGNEALMPDGPSEKTDRRLTNEWGKLLPFLLMGNLLCWRLIANWTSG